MLETDIPGDDRSPEHVFGQRMKRERLRRGWRQEDLAARLAARGIDLHPSAIAKMEREPDPAKGIEPRMIRLNEAEAIAKILECDVDQMLSDDDIGGKYSSLIAELAREQEVIRAQRRTAEMAYLEAEEAELRNRLEIGAEVARLQELQAKSAGTPRDAEAVKRANRAVAHATSDLERRLDEVAKKRAQLKLELSKIEAARARGHRDAEPRHRAR